VGKGKFLDPPGDPGTEADRLIRRGDDVYHILLFALCCLLLVSGCTFPRVVVLKDPLSPEEHLNLGVAYERNGEFNSAIREYKLAAKKLPVAYLYLGNAHFQNEEFGKAEKYYRKSIKKAPRNADAYNNLAWLYCTTRQNLDEAEVLALKAIELNPRKSDIYRDTLEKIAERRMDAPRD